MKQRKSVVKVIDRPHNKFTIRIMNMSDRLRIKSLKFGKQWSQKSNNPLTLT